MKQKLLSIMLVLCLLLCLLPVTAAAATKTEGTCGDTAAWTLSEDGTLTISGTGTVEKNSYWSNNLKKKILKVVISDGITAIDKNAFANLTAMETISIPESVTAIANSAFLNCSALTEITLPQSIQQIEHSTFSGCEGLKTVNLPGGLKEIGQHAFKNAGPELLTIPASVTLIEKSAFYNSKLVEVTLPASLAALETKAFQKCTALEKVTFSGNPTTMGTYVFSGCTALKEVNLPAGMELLPEYTFEGCAALESITLPGSLKTIGKYAFTECTALKEITLPDSVETVESYAFSKCTALEKATLSRGMTELPTSLFRYCAALKTVVLPEGLTKVGNYAFSECNALVSLTLPNSIQIIGDNAFRECAALETVNMPDSLTEVGGAAFKDCPSIKLIFGRDGEFSPFWSIDTASGVLTIWGGAEIPNHYVFLDTESPWEPYHEHVRHLVISEGVEIIGTSAFQSTPFETVSLPSTLTTIRCAAFYNTDSLKEIVLPESVTTLESAAFWGCDALEKVVMKSKDLKISYVTMDSRGEDRSRVKGPFRSCGLLVTAGPIGSGCNIEFAWTDAIPDYAFSSGSAAKAGYGWATHYDSISSVIIPEGVTSIGKEAFGYCKNLTDVKLPSTLTTISDSAFEWSNALASITLPDGVTSVGARAFYGCALTSISLPDSVAEIGKEAFAFCGAMTEARLPASLTSIPDEMFYHCDALAKVTIPDCVTSTGTFSFGYCAALTDIVLPRELTTLGTNTFYKCTGLTSVTLPESLTDIGTGAFANCTALTEITIPKNVSYVGHNAFNDCTGLTKITFTGNAPAPRGSSSACITFDPVTAYYPTCGTGWTEELRAKLGGEAITWVAYDNGHTVATVPAVAPTCIATGLTEGSSCSVCGLVFTAQQEIPMAAHSYDAVVTAPTCTEKGYTTHTCTVCGDSFVDTYTEPAGHSFGDWTVIRAASCTSAGAQRRTCVNCKHYEDQSIPAAGHSAVTDSAVAATCTTAGKTEGSHCGTCNAVLTAQNTVPATGHLYNAVVTAPTCTSGGYTTRTCAYCGDNSRDAYTEPLGHVWNSGVVTKEATEQETGVMTYTCTICRETQTEIIPVLAHTHRYTAAVTAPTCTLQGYTTHTCACGDSYKDSYVDATGHTEVIDPGFSATCATPGKTEGSHCAVCGTTLVVQNEIPAADHSYEAVLTPPTCTEQGYTTSTCTVCGDSFVDVYAEATGHSYEYTVTPPTCTEQGYSTHTCTVCGDSYVDNYVDATGHSDICGHKQETGTSWMLGDVDHSGAVDFFDGMLVLQYYAGLIGETGLDVSVADVDNSGSIDFFDGMYILQFYAGILESLPVE